MKFLCLHGGGTSGIIFSAQTASFRHKLDPERYIFDFVDAPFDSPPAAGIDVFFEPPYYTFWRGTAPNAIKGAHKWLRALLDRQGPYDGLIGFSQGCSLISSFILYHARDQPQAPLPFKCALFICGGVPLTALDDLGCPISAEAWAINERTGRDLREKAGSAGAEFRTITAAATTTAAAGAAEGSIKPPTHHHHQHRGLWDRTHTLEHDPLAADPFPLERNDVFGLDFTRFPPQLRFPIPTAHVYGGKDPRYPAAMQLLCFAEDEAAERRVYDHGGGHDIPRTTNVSERIADLVRWLEGRVAA